MPLTKQKTMGWEKAIIIVVGTLVAAFVLAGFVPIQSIKNNASVYLQGYTPTSSMPVAGTTMTRATQPQTTGGELCNEKRYTSCPSGQKFYCASSGGECVPSDNVFCNGKWYAPCASGYQFSCPTSGSTQCSVLSATSTVPEPRTITAKANVGLLCHYKIADPSLKSFYSYNEDSNSEVLYKGSGVIIDPQGYILTAKHLVDLQWTNWAYSATIPDWEATLNKNSELDYCEVGLPKNEDVLPTPEEIKSINPSITLANPFPYIATLYFNPGRGMLGDLEYQNLDFAVLKITRPMDQCQTFNLCNLPSSFPYNPVLYSMEVTTSAGNQLVNFGYPGELINSSPSTFHDFYLKGAVGPLTGYYGGDKYFKDKPLTFEWRANDVIPGRSGSPVYWQGYVVGIEYAAGSTNTTIDEALGMPAIHQILNDNNLGQILATKG